MKNDPRGDQPPGTQPEDLMRDKSVQRKMNKFDKMEHKLAQKTGLTGDDLRQAMYTTYGDKSWASVKVHSAESKKDGGISNVNSYYPVGDLLDLKNNVTTMATVTRNDPTQQAQINPDGSFTPVNININPGETGTVTVTQTGSTTFSNAVTINQSGAVLANGNVKDPGTNINANFNAINGNNVSVGVTVDPRNIATVLNPTGATGAATGAWVVSTTYNIDVSRTSVQAVPKMPRLIEYRGTFADWVRDANIDK